MDFMQLLLVVVHLNELSLGVVSKENLVAVSRQQLLVLSLALEHFPHALLDKVFHLPIIALFAQGPVLHLCQSLN